MKGESPFKTIIARAPAAVCVLSFAMLQPGAAPAQDFVVDDRVVSDAAVPLVDPEYDRVALRVVWQDFSDQLWIARIDPVSGALLPRDGRGMQVDAGLAPIPETLNGPEWAYGPEGAQIVYTRKLGDSLALAVAREVEGGWQTEVLASGANRWSPIGSGLRSARSRIAYNASPTGTRTLISWREVDDPASEQTIQDATATSARWVEGSPSFVTTVQRDGERQVALQRIDTGTLIQLTGDAGTKYQPFMWFAPETGGLKLMCQIGLEAVGIYSENAEGWVLDYRIELPSERLYVHSPEPFVYGGRSYITVVAVDEFTSPGDWIGQPTGPTDIWIAGIDPAAPFFRQVSIDGITTRIDPEAVVLERGPVVYYTEKIPQLGLFVLRRAETGLGETR